MLAVTDQQPSVSSYSYSMPSKDRNSSSIWRMAEMYGTDSMSVDTYCELVEAQHVHDAYLGYDCPKEVWALIGAGRHQQAAI